METESWDGVAIRVTDDQGVNEGAGEILGRELEPVLVSNEMDGVDLDGLPVGVLANGGVPELAAGDGHEELHRRLLLQDLPLLSAAAAGKVRGDATLGKPS